MICTVTIGTARYDVDFGTGYGIGIPLDFHGPQPNAYSVPHASATAFEGGGYIGDTRLGGVCNFETLTLSPHCNGTHTECVGHLTDNRISVERTLRGAHFPATLITVPVLPAASTSEHYSCAFAEEDTLITQAALRQALHGRATAFLGALIVRTLPNSVEKCVQRYEELPAPYFTLEAMEEIVDRGVQHLLVDIPSLDRAADGGRLAAHRIFWDLTANARDADDSPASRRTVTEMIFVPDHIRDGMYLLNLQIAPFVSDAAPSRPFIFPVSPRP